MPLAGGRAVRSGVGAGSRMTSRSPARPGSSSRMTSRSPARPGMSSRSPARPSAGGGSAHLRRGMKVQAKFRNSSKFFPGVIQNVNRDGTCDIEYDDGDYEKGVQARNIRVVNEDTVVSTDGESPRSSSRSPRDARDGLGSSIALVDKLRQNVSSQRDHDKYIMEFEKFDVTADGKVKARDFGRILTKLRLDFNPGDLREAMQKYGDGRTFVSYRDLMNDVGTGGGGGGGRGSSSSRGGTRMDDPYSSDEGGSFQRGDKVEARFKRGRKYFPGEIESVNRDGTYNIRYDDGDRERSVDKSLIRKVGGGSSSPSGRRKGSPRGRDEPSTGGGGVVEDLIRRALNGRSFPEKKVMDLQDQFEMMDQDATGKVSEREFERMVERARLGLAFADVKAISGELQSNGQVRYQPFVKALRNVVLEPGGGGGGAEFGMSDGEGFADLNIGDPVEARFKNGTKYYKGKISRVNPDGTYDITYDDGDRERRVSADKIRKLGGGGNRRGSMSPSRRVSTRDRGGSGGGLRVGTKVEAKYKSGRKWYKGTISRDNGDGTFDITYDDGDRERGVLETNIKSLEAPGSESEMEPPSAGALDVGSRVEAKFKNGAKWYKGKVTRVNSDGSFDIEYEDGDRERRVPPRNVKPLGGGGPRSSSPSRRKFDDEFSADEMGGHGEILEGDAVEAKFKGGAKWYKGKVTRVNVDGSFDIIYDDGDRERRVAPRNVRKLDGGGASNRHSPRGGAQPQLSDENDSDIRMGDKVEAKYKGGAKWYKGEVTRVNVDGSFDILYEDGDRERRVAPRNVRKVEAASSRRRSASASRRGEGSGGGLRVGMKVEAKFKNGRKWFKGEITRDNRDGTFDIRYDDGDRESGVLEQNIRPLEPLSAQSIESNEINVGTRVEAKYKGGAKWYKGKVTRVNADGSYDIEYDDGDRERRVAPRNVKSLEVGGGRGAPEDDYNTDPGMELTTGSRVEAKYKNGAKWYKGKITRVNADGSFDVEYDDGDRERRVPPRNVRSMETTTRSSSRRSMSPKRGGGNGLRVGSKVEAKYKNGRKWYKGEITRDNRDGTFDIRYDDGDRERGVIESNIRSLEPSLDDNPTTEEEPDLINVGTKVEAKYKGGAKWYKGRVTRVNPDGSYDIEYDDGDRERRVSPRNVRVLGGGRSPSNRGSRSPQRQSTQLREGDPVEAKYKNGRKWYKGKISAVNRDGTFDIIYDDGDRERRVVPENVKPMDPPPRGSSRDRRMAESDSEAPISFARGDKVEAKYKGGRKFYRGTVERAYPDGSCDIRYDDGDFERKVKPELIKSLGGSGTTVRGSRSRSPSSSRRRREMEPETETEMEDELQRGAKVEARFKGGAKYYKGEITRVNGDGTYDIRYDDGDRERGVRANLIRTIGGRARGRSSSLRRDAESSDAAEDFRQGDRIEARYKGGAKYYKGKISRVRPNGTYDLEYDDGDREMRVDARNIRKIGGGGGSRSRSPRSGSKHRSRSQASSSSSSEESSRGDSSEDLLDLLRRVLKNGLKRHAFDDYHQVFEMFDDNRDGYISRKEFGRALDKLGLKFTKTELKRIMKKLDKNGDDEVSYGEFVRLVKRSGGGGRGSRSQSSRRRRSPSRRSLSSSSESEDDRRSSSRRRSQSRRSTSRRRHRSRAASSSDDGGSMSGSDWSESGGDSGDETWDSDADNVNGRDLVVQKFEAYVGKMILKDQRKRFKAAFERLDDRRTGKIRAKDLTRALKGIGINKRISTSLLKKLVSKYGNGSRSNIQYRELVTGCKDAANNDANGKPNTFETKVDSLIDKMKILANGKDLELELGKLDKHNEEVLSVKVIVNYLLKLGFKRSEKSVLTEFVGKFASPEISNGKIPYRDFATFCMSRNVAANDPTLPPWKRATTNVDIQAGLKALREEREKREREGVDPLVWQVMEKLRQIISDALNTGLAKDYADAFELFDLDKNGKIEHEEFVKALEKVGFDLNNEEVGKVMEKLDPDGKGCTVDYKHFLMFCTRGSDRDQWVMSGAGNIHGSTYAGELESSVRQKVRRSALKKKTGRNTMLGIFKREDIEDKGFINKRSLRKIASKMKWNLTNEDVACLMARFDSKGDDKFAYKKFVNFLMLDDDAVYGLEQRIIEFVTSMHEKGAQMKECFDLFDRNRDGKISIKELCSAMMKLGFPVGEDEAKELIRRVDIDRDDKISYVEFARAFAPRGPPQIANNNDENISNENVTALQLTSTQPFNTGVYTDWTDGLVNPNAKIPIGPKGSVGEWLEKTASPMERRNFFAFLQLIGNFEKRLGLQQLRNPDDSSQEGEIELQLGSKLKVSMKFHT